MSKKESTIQRAILDYLNSLPYCYAVTNHGSAWQGAGRPDIFACYQGDFLALEVKTEDGEPTKLQLHELKKWARSGALVSIVRSVEDVKRAISALNESKEKYLNDHHHRHTTQVDEARR